MTQQFARWGHRQGCHETNGRWHLIGCEIPAAELHNFSLERWQARAILVALAFLEHDFSHHDGARDRALARFYQRARYAGMTVYGRFNLFRMNLEAAHIDDPVLAADEVIAPSAQLNHVRRVNEAILVEQRGRILPYVSRRRAAGAQSQCSILDLDADLGIIRVHKLGRKSFQPIVYLKTDAGFGGCESMPEAGVRICRTQVVEQ